MNICQTTGIGSLPFIDSSEAIQYVASSYTIPFYPQLVKHERYTASTVPQMLQEAVPHSILKLFSSNATTLKASKELASIWQKEIPQHLAGLPGIQEFSSVLSHSKSSFFKIQLIGPKTAIHLLEKLCGQKLEEETKNVIAISLKTYGEQLRSYCHSEKKIAILMIDDPLGPDTQCLSLFGIENTIIGIHCCGKFDLIGLIDQIDTNYLSFDLNQHIVNQKFFSNISKLQERSGLMLGIVDTTKQTIDRKRCKILSKQLTEQLKETTPQTQQLPIIFTGGCGTGTQSIDFERQLSALLKELIERV
jgi:hypothetical protein